MINRLISELVTYGIEKGLVSKEDRVYVINKFLELFNLLEYKDNVIEKNAIRDVSLILKDMVDYALENNILDENTITARDLFDTKIMGIITPNPSVVINRFGYNYNISPKDATDYFYEFSKNTNYIRCDRIQKDEKWNVESEYGLIDITINLSKPEKDPKDIAKAASMTKCGYPSCLLCKENEGYSGHISHPARQNHRIIPIELMGEKYFFQYSPYVYYNEHCIIINDKHIPMKINRSTFEKLLEFVKKFPHYTVGSNADLPIVGGSILTHDHFQGGCYTFPMANADYEFTFEMKKHRHIKAGVIKWPLSVIRLQGNTISEIVDAADEILHMWQNYTDEEAFIYCRTGNALHNTITPIARKKCDVYELDLVLRNNITTDDAPWGVYHPSEKYHHIKKENIGLIEVMGLAILPGRLKKEMTILEDALLNGLDIRQNQDIEKHADWVEEWYDNEIVTRENIQEIINKEIGKVFVKVLECAGVYKCTKEGRESFKEFLNLFK